MRQKITTALSLSLLLAGAALIGPQVVAQNLSEELDALENLPPDDAPGDFKDAAKDLDGLPGGIDKNAAKKAAKAPPKTAAVSDEKNLEDLNDDVASDKAVPKKATPVEALPAGEDKNVEEELNAIEGQTPGPPTPGESLTGSAAEPTGKIVGFEFRQLPDRVRLSVKSDRPIDWAKELRSNRKQIILELRNMNISRKILRRSLDTAEFEGPVAFVQPYESRLGSVPSVKVLFQLRQFVDPTVLRSGNEVFIDFPIVTDTALFREKKKREAIVPKTFMSAVGRLEFKGTRINLNAKESELSDILNLLSRVSGKDFIVAGDIKPKVTLRVTNTPWDQVLSIVLLNAKLGYQEIGNTYRILPLNDLKTELDDAQKVAEKADDITPLETRLFPVNYAKAKDLTQNLANFITKRGKTTVDERTNTLVVTDLPDVLEKVGRYLRAIDKQTALIQIEGRIVEAKKDFTKQVNIDWGVFAPTTANSLSGTFTRMGGKAGLGAGAVPGISGNQGGVGLKIGGFKGLDSIQAVLGIAEEETKARTIAAPRVTTLDNVEASLSQGDQIVRLSTTGSTVAGAAATTTATTATFLLDLKVKPQVTADGNVLMQVTLSRDTEKPNNDPTTIATNSRKITTQMLVESGKTGVIGGVYTLDKTETISGWPGLRNLPVFGKFLFTDQTKDVTGSNELLLFISPTILNRDKALITRSDQDLIDNAKVVNSFGGEETLPEDQSQEGNL